jgi:hypothetical protein
MTPNTQEALKQSRDGGTMNRSSSMGLLVFGIVLGVVGAILRYAVEVDPDGFDIHAAGVIMLIVGVATAIVAIALLVLGSSRRSTVTESVQATPTGEVRTETRSDSGPEM